MGQSVLPLRGTLDGAAIAAGEEDPPQLSGRLSETKLEIAPIDIQPPRPQRKRAGADPYAPLGIGSTALVLYPSITAGTVYTSNVNQTAHRQADVGLELRPSLKLESNWIRHSLTAAASGDIVNYAKAEEANVRALNSYARLRLDVRRHTTLNLDSSYVIDTSTDPTEDTLTGGAAITQDFGPMMASLRAGVSRRTYGDTTLTGGGSQDNADLNYVQPQLSLHASFGLSDMLRPYIDASYTPRFHDETPDRNGFNRDSIGFGLAAGLEIASGPIWSGDLGLTYLHRNYNDPALDPASAIGLTGNMTWSPSELTQIVMTAGTSIDETSSAGQSGKPVWRFGVDATHALRDNIELSAGASVEIEDIGATADKTYDANLGVAWKFNPNLAWTAGYDLTWLDSATSGSSYVEHRVSTGLTLSH